ncbi:hypothetical protein MW887_007607 [Aspergillus wentii]|nr:hypothetical protein MW887_007607 [Aspergillus wentii]
MTAAIPGVSPCLQQCFLGMENIEYCLDDQCPCGGDEESRSLVSRCINSRGSELDSNNVQRLEKIAHG